MICMCGLKKTQVCKLCVLWENNDVKKLSQKTENPNPLKKKTVSGNLEERDVREKKAV